MNDNRAPPPKSSSDRLTEAAATLGLPRRVREQTGFAIGGVAPIGHLTKLPVFMAATLFEHAVVWCTAGRPDAVFRVAPDALAVATGATVVEVTR